MFRLFTFKQLAITAFFLCLVMLILSVSNLIAPSVNVFSQSTITVPIIMYHQITAEEKGNDYVLPLKTLEEDFEYLKNNSFTPVSLNALFQFVKSGKPLPEKPIVLTFDDGQKSFITRVLPLLEKYSYPANVNIIGSLVELYTENHDNNDSYAYLNNEDIKSLFAHPLVEIGYHSYNLHNLNTRRGMGKSKNEDNSHYVQTIKSDIDAFEKLFLSITGEKTTIAAYPYGIKNDTLTELLKVAGYNVILTCRESPNQLTVGGDLYELGRFNRPYGKSSKSFFECLY